MGKEPTVKLLSDQLGVPEKDVRMMEQRMEKKDLSLDPPLSSDENSSFLQFETSDEAPMDDDLIQKESLSRLQEAIDQLKDSLSEKEQYILQERLLKDEPLKLQEIGDHWGVTREAVRQMENRLVKKIKKQMIE